MTLLPNEPVFVLGTAQLCTDYGVMRHCVGTPEQAGPSDFLAAAQVLGVCALDTAPGYGGAEVTIGDSAWRGEVHTKVSRGAEPFESVERSMELLHREELDLVYLHDSAVVLNPHSPILARAYRLVGSHTRMLGVSIYDDAEFDAALTDERIGAVQLPLNVLDRRFNADRLAIARSTGTRVYARSVLLQGVLAAPASELPRQLRSLGGYVSSFQSLARELGRTPLDTALAWVRALPEVSGIVVGTSSTIELREVLTAYRSPPLGDDELARIEALPVPPTSMTDPRFWGTT